MLIIVNFWTHHLVMHNTLLFYSKEMLNLFLSLGMVSFNIILLNLVFGIEVTYQIMKLETSSLTVPESSPDPHILVVTFLLISSSLSLLFLIIYKLY